MRRRGPGVAGIKKHRERREKARNVGKQIEASNMEHMNDQLSLFKQNLEEFARRYKHEIKQDPVFRQQFQKMCTKIGVDPLASNKGFWADILGVGAFYTELGIQIIDICLRTRPENGGLIELHVLIQKLEEMRGTNAQRISGDDVKLAISKLSQLGNGFSLVQIGAQKMVVSVPLELSRDHTELLQLAREIGGYVSLPLCSARLRPP